MIEKHPTHPRFRLAPPLELVLDPEFSAVVSPAFEEVVSASYAGDARGCIRLYLMAACGWTLDELDAYLPAEADTTD